jgi:uncharacterized phiE125 gp8 family phage protein
MNLKLITPATTEPVTLTEAKSHLRITDSNNDTYITAIIKPARIKCENLTGRSLAPQTFELILDNFPYEKIEIPMPPVTTLSSIKYKDSDGIETEWTSSEYIFYDSEPAVIVPAYGYSWPSFTPYPMGAVKVRYVAGHTAANIPVPVKQAILLLIGHLFENREAVISGNELKEIPLGINSLLFDYKIWSL